MGRSPLLDALSIPKGETLPPPILQPPPFYPPLERRPLDLKITKEDEYVITVKREFRQFIQNSPFNVKRTVSQGNHVVHYAEAFGTGHIEDNKLFIGWTPEWSVFPSELKPTKTRKRKISLPPPRKLKKLSEHDTDISKLDTLTEEDGTQSGEEEVVEEVVEYDEEEEEEEGDYTMNYFDDGGDDYGGEEDDALEEKEGPCY